MKPVYTFFGGKKLFIALLLFVVSTIMRFADVLSESNWLIVVLVVAGGYGLTNVATKYVHANAKNTIDAPGNST